MLAQAVLSGKTRGYRHHPQLFRFRACTNPLAVIAAYLRSVYDESDERDYTFDINKINSTRSVNKMTVTDGQLSYEWEHLKSKLRIRNQSWLSRLETIERLEPHPIFNVVSGGLEDWENAR